MAYRATLTPATAAHESLVGLWTRNLHNISDAEAKFHWFYLNGPFGEAVAFLLRCDEGPESDVAVGCAGLGVRHFSYGGQKLSAVLQADLAVDQRHRTALPALTLQRTLRRHAQASFDFCYGFPNKHAVALFVRLGFAQLGRMGRWARVLRHAPYLRRVVPPRPLGPIVPAVGALLDTIIEGKSLPSRMAATLKHRLAFVHKIDDRFDELWERAHLRYPILMHRSSAFLRWRYLQKPGEQNFIAALWARRGGKLDGYAIVRRNQNAAELLDLFTASSADANDLLTLILPALRRAGFDSVSMSYLGAPELPQLLERHGFALREQQRTVIVDPGTSSPLAKELLCNSDNWYITDGDEDT